MIGVLAVLLVICMAGLAAAQAPTATIKIEGYSPQEIHDLGWTSPRSTGLSVVGNGQVVYLIGGGPSGTQVNSYAWTLKSKPATSAAVLDSATTRQITFRPDVEGKYVVELVITTAGGSSEPVSVTVTAAKFVGVGGMDGLPSNPAEGQCSLCHATNFTQWTKTGHSDIFTRAIDGVLSDHYSESCVECHTTGYDTTTTALGNNGFFSMQTQLGWQFPAVLQAGNWEALKTNFPALAQRANIQCESCHGPGSQHRGDRTGIAMSLDEAACGYCHEEEPYHRINEQWKSSRHAVGVASASTRNGCDACHSGWGFIRKVDPRQNDNRPVNGFAQISCAVCHDPHRADLPHQMRKLDNVTLGDSVTVVDYGGMGKACMQCHVGRRSAESYASSESSISTHFGPHYSNQADMIDGSNAITYGIPIGSSGHKFATADACVTCHMQEVLPSGNPARDKVGGHSFAMSWDGGTPNDPSDDVEHVTVCQQCHGPIQSFGDILAKADYDENGKIESVQHEIEGMLHKLGMLLPPVGSPDVMTSASLNEYRWSQPGLTDEQIAYRKALLKAAFNYKFVEEDGSHGVHNAGFAFALLRRSIQSITTGDVGAGEIISITDVPNDQGKQVRVAWSKFAGDGLSANPVNNYAIWRRVDEPQATLGKRVASQSDMITQVRESDLGTRFTTASGTSWDFVAWLPAAGREMYSMVVPTLYDSTAAGIYWSVFFISGQAHNQSFVTAADSGYSVDNLVPAPPGNVMLSINGTNVNLVWDDPVDADFQYFAIYRSTDAGFDPKVTTPLSRLSETAYVDATVEIGKTYYYRLSTFDFAGNESQYSPELPAVITSVDDGFAIPTAFALHQNFPNPFNPVTRIRFDVATAGQVQLVVFNSLGQEVATLVDEYLSPQVYVVTFDATSLQSGVYFYRLITNEQTFTKKLILLK